MKNIQAKREEYIYKFRNHCYRTLFKRQLPDVEKPPVRISFGMPPGSREALKTLGCCFRRAASNDGHNEIFLNPTMDETQRILDVYIHEEIHAMDDCASGHGKVFRQRATAVGLVGKMTATTAGDELRAFCDAYVAKHGPVPAASMKKGVQRKPKQSTRMLKAHCGSCGFTARVSRKWAEDWAHAGSTCPVCELESVDIDW